MKNAPNVGGAWLTVYHSVSSSWLMINKELRCRELSHWCCNVVVIYEGQAVCKDPALIILRSLFSLPACPEIRWGKRRLINEQWEKRREMSCQQWNTFFLSYSEVVIFLTTPGHYQKCYLILYAGLREFFCCMLNVKITLFLHFCLIG